MERPLDPLIEALRAAGTTFALLHGSQADGNARSDSDLDVAAYWSQGAPASWEVAVPDGVDLLVLNDAPLEIAGRVAQTGQLLFDDDPKQRVHWQAITRKIWFDERPRFERAHREFLELSVVDETRVARLLRSLSDDVGFLRDLETPDPADPVVMRATKYAFVTAIEAVIDVAQHICAAEGWGPPDTNAQALVLLGQHQVITGDCAAEMATASGFRNVLVHDYVRVDNARVLERLGHLKVFETFISEVADWVQRTS